MIFKSVFDSWVANASIYKITQWKEGIEFEFTPLYDLNAYKIYERKMSARNF